MAESALDRLKRLKAEKLAAAAAAATKEPEEKVNDPVTIGTVVDTTATPAVVPVLPEDIQLDQEMNGTLSEVSELEPVVVGSPTTDSTGVLASGGDVAGLPTVTRPSATHPIAMEMAELEQALDAQVPGFITILKDIHIKLREDPNTVTLLTEEEIAVIVKGLERHANVTISAKAAKSSAKAKKVPIAASDL